MYGANKTAPPNEGHGDYWGEWEPVKPGRIDDPTADNWVAEYLVDGVLPEWPDGDGDGPYPYLTHQWGSLWRENLKPEREGVTYGEET